MDMKSRWFRGIAVSFLLASVGLAEDRNPAGASSRSARGVHFTSELWPGEGRPGFKARKDLTVYKEPSEESEPVRGKRVKAGERIEFTETRFQTIDPVLITLEDDLRIEVSDYGARSYLSARDYYHSGRGRTLELKRGAAVKVLQYRAEGDFLFEVDGRVYGGRCDPCWSASPKTLWWVRTTLGGWIRVDAGSVEFLERTF